MDDLLLITLGALTLAGFVWLRSRYLSFRAQRPQDYAQHSGPDFDVRTHLNGPILCEGVIYGPLGRVTARFHAQFDCSWQGNKGKMVERFWYDDGSIQDRMWRLSVHNDGRVLMKADDVEGEGVGIQSGPTVQMKYKLRLPEGSGGHLLDVVDWMYLAPNGVIMNRSQFRKFGICVAELIATMRPLASSEMKDAA